MIQMCQNIIIYILFY